MDDEQESERPERREERERERGSGRRGPGKPEQPSGPGFGAPADPRRSRSLEYGAALLECYATGAPALGIADLADLVGLSRSTAHRYATTLVALGYLEQDDKRRYRLAPRAGDPGRAALGVLRGRIKARAALEELRERTGYTVSLAVLSGPRAIYVHRLFAHGRGQYEVDGAVEAGASVPLHCSALGKALLACLPEQERASLLDELELAPAGPKAIRARAELERALAAIGPGELVLSDEEQLAGARSLAVALPLTPGAPPLAIEVTVPAAACSARRLLREIGPSVKRAAKLIGGD